MAGSQPHPGTTHGALPQGFRHAGVTYDLLHLRAYETTYTRAADGDKPAVTFKVAVSFSHHCFTRDLPSHDSYDASLLFTHLNEVRLFDSRRWMLSKALPSIAAELPFRECQHANNSNFVTVAVMDEVGNTVDYEVYFRVRKTGRGRLWLNIESAYVRDPERASGRPKGKRIRFLVILHNVLEGKPIRP